MKDKIIEILEAHQSYMGSEHQIIMGDAVPDWEYEDVAKEIDSLYTPEISEERINDLWNLYSSKELGVMTFEQFKAALKELNNCT